jgi:predicted RNA binding protein YcfA (HicA-like mRNA interferase family)
MKAISGKRLARILERRGWLLQRITGSHHIYTKPGSEVRITVPVHGNRTLKSGLQRHLIKLAGIDAADL